MKFIDDLMKIKQYAITTANAKNYGNKPLYYVECKFPYKDLVFASFENGYLGFTDSAHAVRFERQEHAEILVDIIKNIFATVSPEAVVYSKYYQNVV